MIQDPPGSAIRVCAGDGVVIICNSPYNTLLWQWQNETVGSAEYTVYGIGHTSQITHNVPVDFPSVPGLTITLLTNASEGGGSLNSSLQFVVSEEFVEACVTCNNKDYRHIVLAAGKCLVRLILVVSDKGAMNFVTECMLRATSIGVVNVVVDMNTTSFNLMWTTNMAYNSSYFITLSANSENVMNILTKESFVNVILQTNLSYCIDMYYEVKETRKRLEYLQILRFRDNSFIHGNIRDHKINP